jgi:Flp pilus assembly protein TadD
MHVRGKTKKAVTAHRTAVELVPDNPNAYIGLGLALIDEGYTEDALVSLKTALELGGGTDPAVNHRLGVGFAGQRQFPFAVQAFRWCVVQNPRHIEAWFELAAALRKVGSMHEARAAFHALLEMQPAHSVSVRKDIGVPTQQHLNFL